MVCFKRGCKIYETIQGNQGRAILKTSFIILAIKFEFWICYSLLNSSIYRYYCDLYRLHLIYFWTCKLTNIATERTVRTCLSHPIFAGIFDFYLMSVWYLRMNRWKFRRRSKGLQVGNYYPIILFKLGLQVIRPCSCHRICTTFCVINNFIAIKYWFDSLVHWNAHTMKQPQIW